VVEDYGTLVAVVRPCTRREIVVAVTSPGEGHWRRGNSNLPWLIVCGTGQGLRQHSRQDEQQA